MLHNSRSALAQRLDQRGTFGGFEGVNAQKNVSTRFVYMKPLYKQPNIRQPIIKEAFRTTRK